MEHCAGMRPLPAPKVRGLCKPKCCCKWLSVRWSLLHLQYCCEDFAVPSEPLDWNHRAVLDFYFEFIGDCFSAIFAVLTAEKHALKICGEHVAKNVDRFLICRCVFSSIFRFSLATPYFEGFLLQMSQIEEIRAESVLQEICPNQERLCVQSNETWNHPNRCPQGQL